MPKPLRIAIPVIVLGLFIWAILAISLRNGNDNGAISLAGNIEITDTALSFQVPGLMVERLVDEGDTVTKGQVIARLDKAELEQQVFMQQAGVAQLEALVSELKAGTRPERIGQAQAQVKQARAVLAELEAGSRDQELSQAAEQVNQAQADRDRVAAEMELREADYNRASALYAEGVIAKQQLDQAATALKSTRQQLVAAGTRLEAARATFDLVEEGPRSERITQAGAALELASAAYTEAVNGPRPQTIEQAEAQLAGAREGLNLALTRLEYAELKSPAAGTVLSKAQEAGEFVRAGSPIVTIGNLDTVYMRGYINEPDLGRIKLGQSVKVTSDSYPDRIYKGTISYISDEAEFTPKTVQTTIERVKLVYRIKVEIDNPGHELKSGMPVDAVIEAGDGE